MSAKAEAIVESDANLGWSRDVGNVVEIAIRIWGFLVDRRGEEPIADREQAADHFGGAGGGDQVPHHALGARNRCRLGAIPKDTFAG